MIILNNKPIDQSSCHAGHRELFCRWPVYASPASETTRRANYGQLVIVDYCHTSQQADQLARAIRSADEKFAWATDAGRLLKVGKLKEIRAAAAAAAAANATPSLFGGAS